MNDGCVGHSARPGVRVGRLRILLVGAFPPPIGGTTVSLQRLKEYLQSRMLEVRIVDCSARGVHPLRVAVAAVLAVARRARAVDVVTLHFSDRASIWVAPWLWIMCRLLRRPVVFRQFGGEFDRTYASLRRPLQWLLRSTIFRSDAILLQTKQMARNLDFGRDGRVHWFPTARPRPAVRYRAAYSRGLSSRMRCIYVGHIRRAKGVLIAAAAARRVDSVTFDLFGPLVDVTADELRALGATYRGVLDPDEVAPIMAEYDLLLFPTTYPGEGYPGTLVEAAMVGLPMIISRWQHLPEMFDDGEAIFVQPHSVEEVRLALSSVRANPADLVRRSEALRRRAAEFDAENVFARFVEVCENVNRSSRRSAQQRR